MQFLTATHPINPQARPIGWEAAEPIVVGNNVWLVGGVILCPGVTIGNDTVVGVGAVVTRDFPGDVVAVGTPTQILRETWRARPNRRTGSLTRSSTPSLRSVATPASQPRLVLVSTVAAAGRIDDPIAAGHAVLRKSFLALYGQRDPSAGLGLAQQAAETTDGYSQALTGLGLLHAAEAHAMLANRRDCERSLAAAESHLGRIDHGDPAAFLFAEPTFGRLAGSCYLSLGRYQQAQSLLADTARCLQDQPKSLAIVLANLAMSHLRQRQVDAATGVLHQAIDMTARTRGGGGMNLVFDVGRELAPWRHEPVVQHVHDRLHDLMTSP